MTHATAPIATPASLQNGLATRGYAAPSATEPLTPFDFNRRQPGPHDVLIAIRYCGICHSDIHQARDEWGGSLFPMVPGHEIVGTVTQVGTHVSRFKPGDSVGVGCMVDSCRTCPSCQNDLEQFCENTANFTYNSLERDGVTPTYGGYSNQIVVNEHFVLRLPANLPLDQTAPLLCAGITLYSPLRHWQVGPGKKVAIVGMGGLGHMGVKLAHAMGAEVTVLSQSLRKADDAKRFGASHVLSTADPATFTQLSSAFDLIINTVSAPLDWNAYMALLKVDATMVLLGVPESPVPMNARAMIFGRRRLAGSLIGGITETQEMLDFCGQHNLTADIEVIPIQQINTAYERMLKSDVRYRFVIDMASL
jgi:uncharacterized zinc-type alcohol dehydrogenase-like protein